MNETVLTGGRIRGGVWEGQLRGPATEPKLEVRHRDAALPGLGVAADPARKGYWNLRLPVPSAALDDGVQTFLLHDLASGAVLGHFTIVAGVPMEDDLRAEIDLLRAELDLLKRAFRRHCVETAVGGPAGAGEGVGTP